MGKTGKTTSIPLIVLELTADEAVALYHAFVNGLQTGDQGVRRSLQIKVERANSQAQSVRAFHSTMKVANGKEAARA
jgi:hypothetical protein